MTPDFHLDSERGVSSEATRELLLARLIRALDQGDEWALESILERAQNDVQMSQLVSEVQQMWLEEQDLAPLLGAALAVQLAQKHLSSAPQTQEKLKVDEVAGYLLLQGASPDEKDVLTHLAGMNTPVPALLSRANLELLARKIGSSADLRFWRRFKDAAILLRMQRTTPQSQLALAREEKSRSGSSTSIAPQATVEEETQ